MNTKNLFLFILLLPAIIYPQRDSAKIDYLKLSILSGATLGGIIYGYALQDEMWWKGEKSVFHSNWTQDWNYALCSDKYGHFYFGHLISTIYSDAFYWSGFKRSTSNYLAFGWTFTYQTFLEIRDGFSKNYGFSWGDFVANTLGASVIVLEDQLPTLKDFDFKISYFPSERFKSDSHSYIIDDYESTYNWISYDIENILPKSISEYWPEFVNLAIGHSVKNLDHSYRDHEFYLSLDWDIEDLPGDSKFLKSLKKYLNLYHFPAPAIRIYPNVVWYGLKF